MKEIEASDTEGNIEHTAQAGGNQRIWQLGKGMLHVGDPRALCGKHRGV